MDGEERIGSLKQGEEMGKKQKRELNQSTVIKDWWLNMLTVKIPCEKEIHMQAMDNFLTINRLWCRSQCLGITHYLI